MMMMMMTVTNTVQAYVSIIIGTNERIYIYCLHGLLPAPFRLSYSVFDFDFFIIFRFWAVR